MGRKLPGLAAVLSLTVCWPSLALDNGLCRTPPMGWSSWNKFFGGIDEELILHIANAMVSSGMKTAGYRYVNLDDNWMASTRDGQGRLRADPTRFPHGMKWLADSIHNLGLKIGLYSSNGSVTCMGLPASWGKETLDAQTFASWGIDYLKYDNCGERQGTADWTGRIGQLRMRDALLSCGRPIVYSLCQWGLDDVWKWGDTVANLWRTTADIGFNWAGFMKCADINEPLHSYAKPGAWNDPDMMVVDVWDSLTVPENEYRTHFTLWCIMASPLIAGNDLRNMSASVRQTLTNSELIAVNQDSLGKQGRRVRSAGELEYWVKEMRDGSRAVAMVNRSSSTQNMSLQSSDLGLAGTQGLRVRDLWAHADKGAFTGTYTVSVPSRTAVALRIGATTSVTPGTVSTARLPAACRARVSMTAGAAAVVGYAGSERRFDLRGAAVQSMVRPHR